MKKALLLPVFFIFALSTFSQTSMDLSEDQVALLAAREICDCFNEAWNEMDLHPRLISFIQEMGEMGQEKATVAFQTDLMSYSTEVQQQIVVDSNKLENFNMDVHCGSVQEKYDELEGPEAEKKLFSHLADFRSCEMLSTFMQIGSD